MKKHYKKLLFVSILVILMLASTLPAMGAPEKARVFVEFAPGAKGQVQQMLNKEGAQFHYTFDELNSFVVTVPAQALQGLERNPNVVDIEEDVPRYLVKSILTEAAFETDAIWEDIGDIKEEQVLPWGVQAVQATEVWDGDADGSPDPGAITGEGITVCIVDTGFYSGHEDLAAIMADGMSQVDDNWARDGHGHGTHVAGTIAAQDNGLGVIGVSPSVDLYIVKIFSDDGEWIAKTHASDLIAAAYNCADNGANIISMSLSGTTSGQKEQRAFDSLYSQGVLSIAAASNDGIEEYHYPASYASVVSVAALDANEEVADFSQHNDAVEIAAPGVGVLSTVPFTDESSALVNGITYEAHHVEFSGRGTASGELADGGLCTTTGDWSGMVVLCERGDITFAEKILNVEASGGVAAVIYNNLPGNMYMTMGDDSSPVIGISLSQEDGQFLVANKLGSIADITSILTWPDNGYEAWGGTSMATPHVSAVAALLWSAFPDATNAEIRAAMNQTAKDLGDPGRDVYYGFGLVQAKAALDYLGGGPTNTPPTVTIDSPADGTIFESGDLITFAGTAFDVEDGDISADIVWTSSELLDPIGYRATFSTIIPDRVQSITATVTDADGAVSSDSITVDVSGGGIGGDIELSVITNGTEFADRERVYIDVHTEHGEAPLEGANVTVVVTAPKRVTTYTGLTDANGDITFTFKAFIRKYGSGTYTVDVTATYPDLDDATAYTEFTVE